MLNSITIAALVCFAIIGFWGCDFSLVPKTGQTISYATGDDGDLQKGMAWPDPRFTDNEDGTVTDNLTGLIWLKNANCMNTYYPSFDNDGIVRDGRVTWRHAIDFVAGINSGAYQDCGAGHSDWRLPSIRDLQSLIHYGFFNAPPLPDTAGLGQWSEGDPFYNVQDREYWSSTTFMPTSYFAWYVNLRGGQVHIYDKRINFNYVWPVRDDE
jgi:hypothetical protein